MESADSRPMISSFRSPVISALSVKGRAEPFQVLPSAKHYADASVSTYFHNPEIGTDLSAFVAKDDYPLPTTEDREGYWGDDHYGWWLSGLDDYLCIKRAAKQYSVNLKRGDSTFELGCASGRVLRHFACQEESVDVWGADVRLRHVEWVRKFLPKNIRVFQNTILPQLPVEDNSQRIVSAFSVFTHMDDFELAWVAELRRVLVPGGLAYLTIQSEHTWNNMNPESALWKGLMALKEHIQDYKISQDLFNQLMPAPKTVFNWTTAEKRTCLVFHSADYIRNAWGRFLSIKEIIREGHCFQDVVVLQKD
jgi:ubiquinone/menaquinone biosynthesis C-methylase UbiE